VKVANSTFPCTFKPGFIGGPSLLLRHAKEVGQSSEEQCGRRQRRRDFAPTAEENRKSFRNVSKVSTTLGVGSGNVLKKMCAYQCVCVCVCLCFFSSFNITESWNTWPCCIAGLAQCKWQIWLWLLCHGDFGCLLVPGLQDFPCISSMDHGLSLNGVDWRHAFKEMIQFPIVHIHTDDSFAVKVPAGVAVPLLAHDLLSW